MADDFKYDVFLSHSSKDKDVARDIAERLRKDGLRVWFEDWEIRLLTTKEGRRRKIEKGLEHSRVLVLCISKNAFGPEWVQLESGTFRFRDPLNKNRRFVPLRLDQTSIRVSIEQFSHIDWFPKDREREYGRFLEACRPPVKLTSDGIRKRLGWDSGCVIKLDLRAKIRTYAFSSDGKRVLGGGLDGTVWLWDIETGRCLGVLEGHSGEINSISWSTDQRCALSGSTDTTMRLWGLEAGRCLTVFQSNSGYFLSTAWSSDQRHALSGHSENTVRLWHVKTGRCLRLFKGHSGVVLSVSWSADQRRATSGSDDNTVRLWDVETGRCLHLLKGHTGVVFGVAWSPDQHCILSASGDKTIRLWDVEPGLCLRILEGHTGRVISIAWSADSRRALSGAEDNTVRLWDVETGHCLRVFEGHTAGVINVAWSTDNRRALSGDSTGIMLVWDLSEFVTEAQALEAIALISPLASDQIQYTNAKVLLVGESGAGKTGLTERLAHDTFTPSYSTAGTWSTQWQMKDLLVEPGWEREVWLWDFGGQADQRLIHQLYVDETALILFVFNADRDVVVPGLREWQQALSRCVSEKTRTYLVAGRIDVGFRFDREKVRAFAREHDYEYFETSANDGRGCLELRGAIQAGIPWTQLERRTSPTTWKLLKDEMLKLRDEGQALFTFKELRETLRLEIGRRG